MEQRADFLQMVGKGGDKCKGNAGYGQVARKILTIGKFQAIFRCRQKNCIRSAGVLSIDLELKGEKKIILFS